MSAFIKIIRVYCADAKSVKYVILNIVNKLVFSSSCQTLHSLRLTKTEFVQQAY